jgi:hypothetical protein
MNTSQHQRPAGAVWQTPTGYAASHCRQCEMGWTRAGQDGALTICLLDREPVLENMTNCDRYAPRALAPEPAA